MPQRLVEKATGKVWSIPDAELADALASGLYEPPSDDATVTVVEPSTGLPADVAVSDLPVVQQRGARVESPGEFRAREDAARIEREHGGLAGTAGAFVEGAVDAGTLGLYGLAADAIAGDDYADDRRERAQANPVAHTAGEVTGIVAPALLSGGTGAAGTFARATPAGAASQLGARISARGGIGASALGVGVEGALQGFGQGVSELTISEDPVTLERAVSTLSSSTLLGGTAGAGFGAFGSAAGKGLRKAKALVDDAREQLQKRAAVTDDLRGLGKKELREAEQVELARLKEEAAAGKVAERAAAADEVIAYSAALDEANPFLAVEGQPRALLTRTKRSMRRVLDEPVGLRESPRRALDPLRRQAQALRRAIDEAPQMAEKLAREEAKLVKELGEELATLPDAAESVTITGKLAKRYSDFAGVKVGTKGASLTREEAEGFLGALRNGEVQGARAKALQDLEGVLRRNEELQQRIVRSLEAPGDLTSPRLSAIADARDALDNVGGRGLMGDVAQGAVFSGITGAVAPFTGWGIAPIIGAAGAKKLTDLVFGRLGRTAAKASERTTRALDAFFDVGRRVSKAAPPVASKALASTSFGPEQRLPRAVAKMKAGPLLAAYREREAEIRSQTVPGPNGPEMSAPARAALGERLSGVRALSPQLADQIETQAARRIEFLASKLPRRPDIVALQLGPDRWRPSDMAMREFGRYVAAVEDPGAVEERLADGSVTPEDAEAYRAVYPDRHADLVRQIVERLPELRESLPYERRLALSIFTGVPVDAAMEPRILRILQAQYTDEPGTEGGMRPPQAEANFGSLTKPEPTPAQDRAAG